MKPQFIEQNGKPAFVVLTIEDYNAMMMTDEDLMRQARADDSGIRYPNSVMKRLIAGDNPVKVFREWRGLNQEQLAARTGLHKNFISMLETGTRTLTAKTAAKIAEALAVDLDMLTD